MAGRERETHPGGSTVEASRFSWTPDRFNARVRTDTRAPRAGAVPPDVKAIVSRLGRSEVKDA